jgi:hypothetical protein
MLPFLKEVLGHVIVEICAEVGWGARDSTVEVLVMFE